MAIHVLYQTVPYIQPVWWAEREAEAPFQTPFLPLSLRSTDFEIEFEISRKEGRKEDLFSPSNLILSLFLLYSDLEGGSWIWNQKSMEEEEEEDTDGEIQEETANSVWRRKRKSRNQKQVWLWKQEGCFSLINCAIKHAIVWSFFCWLRKTFYPSINMFKVLVSLPQTKKCFECTKRAYFIFRCIFVSINSKKKLEPFLFFSL